MKYVNELSNHFRSRNIFTMRDARLFLQPYKISPAYLKVLLHSLLKKEKIHSITKGAYTFQGDPIVAGFAFEPFYYGLHHALSIHSLWDQAANIVIITAQKVRSGQREIMGSNVILRRIRPRFLNHFELVFHSGKWIPVSTVEKTLVDFIYFRQKLSREIAGEFRKRIDKKILKILLKKYPAWVSRRVWKTLE